MTSNSRHESVIRDLVEKYDDIPALMSRIRDGNTKTTRFHPVVVPNQSVQADQVLRGYEAVDKGDKARVSRMAHQAKKVLDHIASLPPPPPLPHSKSAKSHVATERTIRESAHVAASKLRTLQQAGVNINQFYQQYDVHRQGRVSHKDFADTLVHLCSGVSRQELLAVAAAVDEKRSGSVCYHDILQKLKKVRDAPTNAASASMLLPPPSYLDLYKQRIEQQEVKRQQQQSKKALSAQLAPKTVVDVVLLEDALQPLSHATLSAFHQQQLRNNSSSEEMKMNTFAKMFHSSVPFHVDKPRERGAKKPPAGSDSKTSDDGSERTSFHASSHYKPRRAQSAPPRAERTTFYNTLYRGGAEDRDALVEDSLPVKTLRETVHEKREKIYNQTLGLVVDPQPSESHETDSNHQPEEHLTASDQQIAFQQRHAQHANKLAENHVFQRVNAVHLRRMRMLLRAQDPSQAGVLARPAFQAALKAAGVQLSDADHDRYFNQVVQQQQQQQGGVAHEQHGEEHQQSTHVKPVTSPVALPKRYQSNSIFPHGSNSRTNVNSHNTTTNLSDQVVDIDAFISNMHNKKTSAAYAHLLEPAVTPLATTTSSATPGAPAFDGEMQRISKEVLHRLHSLAAPMQLLRDASLSSNNTLNNGMNTASDVKDYRRTSYKTSSSLNTASAAADAGRNKSSATVDNSQKPSTHVPTKDVKLTWDQLKHLLLQQTPSSQLRPTDLQTLQRHLETQVAAAPSSKTDSGADKDKDQSKVSLQQLEAVLLQHATQVNPQHLAVKERITSHPRYTRTFQSSLAFYTSHDQPTSTNGQSVNKLAASEEYPLAHALQHTSTQRHEDLVFDKLRRSLASQPQVLAAAFQDNTTRTPWWRRLQKAGLQLGDSDRVRLQAHVERHLQSERNGQEEVDLETFCEAMRIPRLTPRTESTPTQSQQRGRSRTRSNDARVGIDSVGEGVDEDERGIFASSARSVLGSSTFAASAVFDPVAGQERGVLPRGATAQDVLHRRRAHSAGRFASLSQYLASHPSYAYDQQEPHSNESADVSSFWELRRSETNPLRFPTAPFTSSSHVYPVSGPPPTSLGGSGSLGSRAGGVVNRSAAARGVISLQQYASGDSRYASPAAHRNRSNHNRQRNHSNNSSNMLGHITHEHHEEEVKNGRGANAGVEEDVVSALSSPSHTPSNRYQPHQKQQQKANSRSQQQQQHQQQCRKVDSPVLQLQLDDAGIGGGSGSGGSTVVLHNQSANKQNHTAEFNHHSNSTTPSAPYQQHTQRFFGDHNNNSNGFKANVHTTNENSAQPLKPPAQRPQTPTGASLAAYVQDSMKGGHQNETHGASDVAVKAHHKQRPHTALNPTTPPVQQQHHHRQQHRSLPPYATSSD